ncbi:MAG: hypothetical protein OQK52_01280 [Ignavibacteriaceae bacterium]|jgi:hypothetical protein|nr:hypothetical protein [Ignavibacteriaceae bacterium]MCW8960919.1 hypothetical protein [Ignavibacteriaceae bacterium]
MTVRNNFLTLMFGSFFILMIFNSYAQEQERNLNNDFDSTYRFQGIIPPIEFQYNFDEMFSKSLTVDFPDEVVFDNNPSTIWLRTELLISNKSEGFSSNEINTHFTSPLFQQYLKDSEFDMFRTILGAVQASAVAYMAYLHIKKYGFWK